MNILVTGATGFIGSHLVRKLLNQRHKVFISVRSTSSLHRINNVSEKLIQVNVDRSLDDIRKTFQENSIDGIIHLAAFYRKEDSAADIKQMNQTNIDFPLRLLSIAKDYKSTFFINTGTCFEYAPSKNSINENSTIKPFNYYTSTKIEFEKKLIKAVQNSSMRTITLKLFFPYGEQDNNKLVKLLVENLILKKKFHVTKGEQYLSYTYVDDITNAYMLALDHILTMSNRYNIYNIGGHPVKVSEIFDTLEEISNTRGYFIRDKEYPQNEIMSMYTCSEKARRELGWEQKWNLEEGLQRTYNYYLTHH